MSDTDAHEWSTIVRRHEYRETDINKKIDKYNLIVPILDQQMCRIQLKRIADRVISSKPVKIVKKVRKVDESVQQNDESNKGLLSFFWWS